MPIISTDDNTTVKRLGVVSKKEDLQVEDLEEKALKNDQKPVVSTQSVEVEDPIETFLEEDKNASKKYNLEYDIEAERKFWQDLFDATPVLES